MIRFRSVLRALRPIGEPLGYVAALVGLYQFANDNPGVVAAIMDALFQLPMRWVMLAIAMLIAFVAHLVGLLPDGRTLGSCMRLGLTMILINLLVFSLLPAPRSEVEFFVSMWTFGSYLYVLWRAERVDLP